jgi:pyruvate dehydrogenase E2 component (dihydrolipoamide acetyltransferase)
LTGVRLPEEAWEDVDEGVDGLLEEWLAAEGDSVEAGQPIASAIVLKTSHEVLASGSGTLESILVAAGETFGPDQDLAVIDGVGSGSAPPDRVEDEPAAAAPAQGTPGSDSSIPLTGIRGAVARNMAAAWQHPRVAAAVEVDMRACLEQLAKVQEDLGTDRKVTPTHLLIRALALTLAEHPRLNGTIEDDRIEVSSEISLGLAVSLAEGVMVPILHDVGSMAVSEIVAESSRLASEARSGQIGSADLTGGSFTLSTLGSTGIDWFTPVLNSPHIAILGVGAVRKRALVEGDSVIPAPTMALTLVYDHRAIDGHPASQMLFALKERLERGDLNL